MCHGADRFQLMFKADLQATEMSPPTDVSVGLRSAVLAFGANWLLHHCRDGSQPSAAGDFIFGTSHSATRGHKAQYSHERRCAAGELRCVAAAEELANTLGEIEVGKPGGPNSSARPGKGPGNRQGKGNKPGTKPAGEPRKILLV